MSSLASTAGNPFAAYGGKSLHEQSHGESFLAVMINRFGPNGFYLLDKPEAARLGALSMTLGAVGMVACCTVAALLVPRLHAIVATGVGWVVWVLVTFGLYALLLR